MQVFVVPGFRRKMRLRRLSFSGLSAPLRTALVAPKTKFGHCIASAVSSRLVTPSGPPFASCRSSFIVAISSGLFMVLAAFLAVLAFILPSLVMSCSMKSSNVVAGQSGVL